MAALLFFASFATYLTGLSGTVPVYRDSGDLIVSIYTLGIAHPPGYALYVLVGKLFILLLPIGNVAYRVNVMSAVFGALAAAALYLLLRRQHRFFAGVTAILFATSPAVMALSRVAEMYTMSAFLAVLIVAFLVSDHPNALSWAALFLGLGLSVHLTLIFLAPLFVSAYRRISVSAPNRRTDITPILYFLLGLSVFLYLPIRAAQDPLLNWGNPSHWRNFWRVVTRADYGGLKLHPEESVFAWTPTSVGVQLKYFVTTFANQWGWAALAMGLWGVLKACRPSPTSFRDRALLLSWILSGPAFFVLSNLPLTSPSSYAILEPYLLVAGVLWAPFVVSGLQACHFGTKPKLVAAGLTLLLLLSKPWSWTSSRNDFFAYDYARNILRSLPPNAVLFDPDDTTHFSIRALQILEGRRPDVALISFFRTRWGYEQIRKRRPELLPPIPIESSQELQRLFWDYSAKRYPFYAELPQKFAAVPHQTQGLIYAASIGPGVLTPEQSKARAEALLELAVRRGDFLTTQHKDFFTKHLLSYYSAAHCNLGLEYAAEKKWDIAVRHYQKALAIEPDLPAAYNNWGIVAFEQQNYPKAAELFKEALRFDPLNEMLQKNVQIACQKMAKNL